MISKNAIETIQRAAVLIMAWVHIASCANLINFKTKEFSVYSKKEYLTTSETDARISDYRLLFTKNDSLYTTQPRNLIMNNFACWSGADSDPVCSTYVVFAETQTTMHQLKKETFAASTGISKATTDSLLREFFSKNINTQSITLKHYEETDRGWAVLEGLMFGTGIFVIAAAGELVHSLIASQPYNVGIPGVIGSGTFLIFSGYRFITMETNPSCTIYKIHFTADF